MDWSRLNRLFVSVRALRIEQAEDYSFPKMRFRVMEASYLHLEIRRPVMWDNGAGNHRSAAGANGNSRRNAFGFQSELERE